MAGNPLDTLHRRRILHEPCLEVTSKLTERSGSISACCKADRQKTPPVSDQMVPGRTSSTLMCPRMVSTCILAIPSCLLAAFPVFPGATSTWSINIASCSPLGSVKFKLPSTPLPLAVIIWFTTASRMSMLPLSVLKVAVGGAPSSALPRFLRVFNRSVIRLDRLNGMAGRTGLPMLVLPFANDASRQGSSTHSPAIPASSLPPLLLLCRSVPVTTTPHTAGRLNMPALGRLGSCLLST